MELPLRGVVHGVPLRKVARQSKIDTPALRHAGICIEHRSMQHLELHQGVEVAVRAGPPGSCFIGTEE